MPQRFLRPGITNSGRWNSVSFEAQSLFIRILTLVDDFGRYDARIPILHGQCFALRNDIKPQRTAALRSELQASKLIEVYAVEDREYLQITQWQERARTERSKFPNPTQVVDISTSAADRCGPQRIPASIAITPSPSTIDHKPDASGYAVPACFESVDGFSVALAGWIESRKKNKCAPTGMAIQFLVDRLAQRPGESVEALNLAIERGWKTVKWDWFDNEKITTNGKRSSTHPSGSPNRNANLNANADYSVIPKRTGEAPHWSEGSPG